MNKKTKYTKLTPGLHQIGDGTLKLLTYEGMWVKGEGGVPFIQTKYTGYPATALDYKALVDEKRVYGPSRAWYLWWFKPSESDPPPQQFFQENRENLPYLSEFVGPDRIEGLVSQHPELADVWSRIPRWVVRADIARLLLVYHYGGFYLDSDAQLRRRIIPQKVTLVVEKQLSSPNGMGPRENPEQLLRIANYAFGAARAKEAFFLEALQLAATRIGQLLKEGGTWTDADVLWVGGPDVITTVYHKHKDKEGGWPGVELLDSQSVLHTQKGSWRGN